ncbi:glycine N-acyltransferase-like protein 3 isoform X2 [Babylonia areolata]|uniref:glycine N-acyltransferase-like protein 3 isoform X2 n=1 Tax=Babylonia areolata TaxID=304850 RepID=UPI003FD499C2
MATKLSKTQLPQLLPLLEQHLPHSYKVHCDLQNHLGGQYPELEFFVDRWPHPQAAVSKVNTEQMVRGGQGKPSAALELVEGIWGLSDDALSSLLKDPSVLEWNKYVTLSVTVNQKAVVQTATEMGKSSQLFPCTMWKATRRDLPPIPAPEGVKLRSATTADVGVIISTWKFGSNATEAFVRTWIQDFPSVYLETETGQHVGHMTGKSGGTMGLLYVNPEFRRKGYAKVIVTQLAQKYFDRGEVYVRIQDDNQPSQCLHKSLGFREVPDSKVVVMWCG